jgi:23S rRNA-/tRNA-specific pseudouridylate synthase
MNNTIATAYTNWEIFLLWKPRNLASARWKEWSLLHLIKAKDTHPWVDLSEDLISSFQEFLDEGKRKAIDRPQATNLLHQQWTSDQEFGLLNRLDTPTGGFLTFAANPKAKEDFLILQRQWDIDKHYLAVVSWNPEYLVKNPQSTYPNLTTGSENPISVQDSTITISVPLKHHRHLDDRMVAIKSDKDHMKWRDGLLECTTVLTLIKQNEKNALVQCVITKGQRHQIRVHCQTLGYPILGDGLYGKDKSWELELWSMGFSV